MLKDAIRHKFQILISGKSSSLDIKRTRLHERWSRCLWMINLRIHIGKDYFPYQNERRRVHVVALFIYHFLPPNI